VREIGGFFCLADGKRSRLFCFFLFPRALEQALPSDCLSYGASCELMRATFDILFFWPFTRWTLDENLLFLLPLFFLFPSNSKPCNFRSSRFLSASRRHEPSPSKAFTVVLFPVAEVKAAPLFPFLQHVEGRRSRRCFFSFEPTTSGQGEGSLSMFLFPTRRGGAVIFYSLLFPSSFVVEHELRGPFFLSPCLVRQAGISQAPCRPVTGSIYHFFPCNETRTRLVSSPSPYPTILMRQIMRPLDFLDVMCSELNVECSPFPFFFFLLFRAQKTGATMFLFPPPFSPHA